KIVKLQHLVVQRIRIRWTKGFPWRAIHLGAEEPAFMVQRPLAHHFEVLGRMARWHLGILRIERVSEARAFDRLLLYSVDNFGGTDAGSLEDGRHDVDDVHELLAQAALVLYSRRPRHHHVLVDASKRRGVLLEPGERR